MVLTAGDGAFAARAADVVELTLEDVRAIARSLVAPHDEVQTQQQDFLAAPTDAGMFGRSPGGEAVHGAHRTAHEVFTETVRQVAADLEAFRERLEASVTTYEARDGDVEDALLSVRAPGGEARAVIDARGAAHLRPAPAPGPAAPQGPDAPAAAPQPPSAAPPPSEPGAFEW